MGQPTTGSMPTAGLPRPVCCHRRQPASALEPTADDPSSSPSSTPEPETTLEPAATAPVTTEALQNDARVILTVGVAETVYIGLVGLEPTEVQLIPGAEVRWYAVWSVPGQSQETIAGVHWGQDTRAYSSILQLNGGHFGGIRWRRCDNRAAAQATFSAEAHRYGLEQSRGERLIGWVNRA